MMSHDKYTWETPLFSSQESIHHFSFRTVLFLYRRILNRCPISFFITMLIRAIRRLSTRTPVFSRFYNIIESSSTNDKQQILEQVSHALRKERNALPVNSLHDLIQHRANEEPKKEALFFAGNKINECQILTFDDVYQQTCRWSNALSGKEFGLEKGQTVCDPIDISVLLEFIFLT